MTNFLKALTFGVMLAASSTLAFASPLSGTIAINGGQGAISPTAFTSTSTPTTILFATTNDVTNGGTGSFATTLTGPPLGALGIEYVNFTPSFTIPNTLGNPFGGQVLFTFLYNNTTTETFTVTSVTTGANGSLFFYGTLSDTVNGVNPGGAVFDLTPDISHNGSFGSNFVVTPTPEPSSLILLGTGLIGAAGLMFRKRGSVIA